MATVAPYLALRGLAKRYGEGPAAVAGLDLAAERGEFLTLLGPSGCGKTTVLRMIAGLVPPSAGRIAVDGADVTAMPAHRRNMGLVFQNYALFPHLNVARNVAFGLEMRGTLRDAIDKRVTNSLALVRLEGLRRRMPRELSGGQQQRVALARALVIEPALLLLDERPASEFVAAFIGRTNRIAAIVVSRDAASSLLEAGTLRFTASTVLPVGAKVTAMIRPHRIRLIGGSAALGETVNQLRARVRKVVFAGDVVQCEIAADGVVLTVESQTASAARTHLVAGEEITAAWLPADTLVFAAR